eukprot:jgi/Ulvmu1/2706/UM014_0162.1
MKLAQGLRTNGEQCSAAWPARASWRAQLLKQPTSLVKRDVHRSSQRLLPCQAGTGMAAPPLQRIISWVQETMGKKEKIVLSSHKSDLTDTKELAGLWAEQLDKPELLKESGLQAVETALHNSFTVQFAFLETTDRTGESEETTRTLIGCARSISDGFFAAQVVDVCVSDEHRRKGLGSQMLKELCKDTREKGAQSIAVFTGPNNRLFFWRNGFRLDFRYRVMVYQPLKTRTSQPSVEEASVSDLNEVFETRYM